MARDINPELQIRRFDSGVTPDRIDAFLDGADLFADGLDFFEIPIRRQIFARCAERGIPAVTAAPIGMGVGFLIFQPRGMRFEQYFRLDGQPENEQFLRFLLGLAPAGLRGSYLVDRTRVDLAARQGPSTIAAIQLCAGVTAVAAVKLLLGRGDVKAAPWHHHYDAYRDRLVLSRLRFGNAGPLQRAKLAIARHKFGRRTAAAAPPRLQPAGPSSTIEEILDLGRWAPSGDNTQPWRFRILDAETVAVDLRRNATGGVYEYRGGEPTLLAAGMLIETLRVAATAWQRGMNWEETGDPDHPGLLLRFPPAPGARPDPLLSFLTLRSVDRRGYRRRQLTGTEKQALEACLGDGPGDDSLVFEWHEGSRALRRFGRLNALATDIRLRAAEAFPIHQRVLDWTRVHSPDAIPVGAVGLPGPMLPLMRWSMRGWSRMRLLNRLGGAATTALLLDRWPARNSAAFFVISRRDPSPDSAARSPVLRAGGQVQRLWLTATRLGLALQPVTATLAFADHGASGAAFTADADLRAKAALLAQRFQAVTGRSPRDVLFVGRIGEARPRLPGARSIRLPLEELIAGTAGSASASVP